jgi:hypothetical protein
MGVNNPNLPSNVLSDEEAIQYLAAMVQAQRMGTIVGLTGSSATGTAAQMVGGVFDVTGGSTFTLTTDTAANIIAYMNSLAVNGGAVGSTFSMMIINENTGSLTLTPGTGVTLAGVGTPGTIVTLVTRRYLGKVTGAAAVTLYGL